MIYKSGLEASWNPGMSEPSRTIRRALYVDPSNAYNPRETNQPGKPAGPVSLRGLYGVKGLSGIDGLSFSYRLQQWGPKVGPSMIPADAFHDAYVPEHLGSPLTWIEGVLGIESVPDLLKGAKTTLQDASSRLAPLSLKLQNVMTEAAQYKNATESAIQNRAQALQAQGAGLIASLSTLQNALAKLLTQIQNAQIDTTVSKDTARLLRESSENLLDQVSAFEDSLERLEDGLVSLQKSAQAGPSSIQNALISSVTGSVSTLTWIIGGSLAFYVLGPTLLPRLIGGVKKGLRA